MSAEPSRRAPLLESTLDALGSSDLGADWLDARKRSAADAVRRTGLPNNRQEEWRFTSLRALSRLSFDAGNESGPERRPPMASFAGHPVTACTVGGLVVQTRAAGDGVSVLSLADALARVPHRVEPHLMRLSKSAGGFARQNDALFRDAVVVLTEAGAEIDTPVVVVHATDGSASYPRMLVVAENRSRLSLAEVFVSELQDAHLQNAAAEIVLGAGSRLEHVRLVTGTKQTFSLGSIDVEQDRDSSFASRAFTLGGPLSRVDLTVRLVGSGANAELDGLYTAREGDQVDHHTVVRHQVAHASSNQLYKGIVGSDGHAVFDGTVFVSPGASGTVAHQKNENLLLADTAVVHTKPHLEIDTDDVVCSHGATVGRLDEAQLFYLRSRGIDERTARAILVDAFTEQLVERVEDPNIRTAVREAVHRAEPWGRLAEALS